MNSKDDNDLLNALDVRLSSIIMSPAQTGDRSVLLAILKLISAAKPEKRSALWQHFERTVGKSCRRLVSELHATYETIAAELEKSSASEGRRRLAEMKARLAAMPASMEGD
jgi:hypothetical protein